MAALPAEETGHRADGDSDDHRSEDVGEQRVAQRGAADALGGDVGVRDLERHPDRQGEVGEVHVVRGLAMEVDPALRRAVVVPRVAQEIDGVHRHPGQRDAPDGERGQQAALGRPSVTRLPEREHTASRLPAPAPSRTASAAARESSSVRAWREVAGASAVAMVDQTQTRNTSAAMSSANSAATDHDAPPTTASAAATAPPAAPTITRRAARPERAPVTTDSAASADR